MSDERTEEASPQRLRQARERGQASKSQDFAAACSLLLVVATLSGLTPILFASLTQHLRQQLTHLEAVPAAPGCGVLWSCLGALLLAAVAGSTLAQWAGQGWMWTLHPIQPDLQRLNPVENARRWFSGKMLVDALKMSLKLLGLLGLSWGFVNTLLNHDLAAGNPLAGFLDHLWLWLKKVTVFYCLVGLADLLYQRWEFRKSMRMSKHDLKQEYRQQEGDPQRKWRARSLGQKLLKQRSLNGVKKASVVITNPTHLAVALEFHLGLSAPKVVAKGADKVAQAIRKLARKHRVPLVENRALARALYPLDIDDTIPTELFGPVAEILVAVARAEQESC